MNRFTKLAADGNPLPAEATDWAQVLDTSTGLIWSRDPLLGKFKFAEVESAAAGFKLGDQVWRAPTIAELFTIADHSRFEPAINTDFFNCPSAWFWSSTVDASSPGYYAWVVYFYHGDAGCYNQGSAALVRPVRSSRASQ